MTLLERLMAVKDALDGATTPDWDQYKANREAFDKAVLLMLQLPWDEILETVEAFDTLRKEAEKLYSQLKDTK